MKNLESQKLQECVAKLDGWANQIADVDGHGPRVKGTFSHSSEKLLNAVWYCFDLKGGAQKLSATLKKAVPCVVPAFLAGIVSRNLDKRQSDAVALVPGATTVRQGSLVLDLAFSRMRQRLNVDKDMARFLWSDSSPMFGFDWLWTQAHELPRDQLAATCQAVLSLREKIDEHVAAQTVRQNFGQRMAFTADSRVTGAAPLAEWKPLLKQLCCIEEQTRFTPVRRSVGIQ